MKEKTKKLDEVNKYLKETKANKEKTITQVK